MNNKDENIFFSLNEKSSHDGSDDFLDELTDDFLDEFDFINQITDEEKITAMSFEYKINYTVKELLLICEYYGIAKEIKVNKCNKEEIILILVNYENNPINNNIVLRRHEMWYCINKLKEDKFMKKYIIW